MRSQRRLVRPVSAQIGPPIWIYDTSTFYSDDLKITVQRSSDSVIRTFKPSEITNGVYNTWLNGSTGIVKEVGNDGNKFVKAMADTELTFMLTDGSMDNSAFSASFDGNEYNEDTIIAFVAKDIGGVTYSGRTMFNPVGSNTQFSISYRNYQATWFLAYQFPGQAVQRIGWNYTNTVGSNENNVMVFDFVNGQPRLRINGTIWLNPNVNNTSTWPRWRPYDASTMNKLFLGGGNLGKHRNFSLYQTPVKTSQEISDELMAIYRP